jgi:hypothetical protein
MILHTDIIQRSEEWFKIKLGKFSATDFQTVANGKKPTIENLIYKKAAEIITGHYQENDFTNRHIERGVELEEEARVAFEMETGLSVLEVGFIELNEFVGVSPDGIIGDNAGLELKCKDDHTHLKCLLNGDNSYKWQIQGSLYVSGRESWFFASYNQFFPSNKRIYIKEHKPDKECFDKLESGLDFCITRLKETLKAYGN